MAKITEKQKAQVIEWIDDAKNSTLLETLRSEARANRDFYEGKQWDANDYNYYKYKGVEPITVNRIKPIVKTALGIYLQNKQDIRVISNNTASGYAAGVANKVLKNAEQKSGSQKKYERLFMYGSVDKVAYLKYETNPYKTENGQPALRVLTVFEVDYDPACKSYSLNDGCRYIVEKEWIDKDEAEMLYSSSAFKRTTNSRDPRVELISMFTNVDSGTSIQDKMYDDENEIDTTIREKNKVMVRHVWWKELIEGYIVSDGKIKKYTKDKVVADQLEDAGYEVETVPDYKLHKTTVYNNEVIATKEEPLGKDVNAFPFFRYSPLYYDGANIGIIDNLLSLNSEENHYRTLVQKYLANTINNGFIVGGGTPEAIKELSDNAGRDDIVIDKRKYGNDIEQINPGPFPVSFQMQANEYDNLIKSVSGISDSMLGTDSSEQSGRAIYLRTQQNKIQFQEILENLFTTIQEYGSFLLNYIITNEVYTDDEVIKIVDEADMIDPALMQRANDMLFKYTGGIQLTRPNIPAPPSPELMAMIRMEDKPQVINQIQMGTKAAQEYAEQYPRLQKNFENTVRMMAKRWLLEQYRSEDFKNYSVEVVTSPHAPTEAMAVFAQAIDLNNAVGGGAIPLNVLADLSILPDRTKQEIKQNAMVMPQGMQMNNTNNIMGQMAATGQM